jgi:hypothetical protein
MVGTTPYLTGTFLPVDPSISAWTQARWNQEFADMKAVGIVDVILQIGLSEDFGSAYYPAPWPATNPNQIATPAAPTVTGSSTAGTLASGASYAYRVAENRFDGNQGTTLASAETVHQNGAVTPAAPTLAVADGGTLTAGATYAYRVTENNATGETLASAETSIVNRVSTPVISNLQGATGGTLPIATYAYRVSATDAGGETLASAEVTLTTVIASRQITVTWSAVPGATGYRVYGRTSGSELFIGSTTTATSFVDTGSVTPAGALPASNTTAPSVITVTGVLSNPANHLKVYGRTAGGELLMATLSAGTLSWGDYGAITPAGALPTSNTTGASPSLTITGVLSSTSNHLTVYGRTAGGELLLATLAPGALTWTDTGAVTPSGALPAANTTAPAYYLAADYTSSMLAAANSTGCRVWFGLANVSAWFLHVSDDADGGAAWFTAQGAIQEQVAAELWALHGTDPAFAGWYLSNEVNSYALNFAAGQTPMKNYFGGMISSLHASYPGIPVMISPSPLGYGTVGPLPAATWAAALLNVLPGIDVINSQDVAGSLTQTQVLSYVSALNAAIAAMSGAKPAQWSNPDMFDDTTYTTMAPAKLQSDLIAEAPYVAKFTGFSFWSQMGPHDLATSHFYDSYRDYWLGQTEWTYFYNGLTFGEGTNVGVVGITGLEDIANIRNADVARPNAHGMLGGYDYLGARSIILTLAVKALPGGSLAPALDAVKAAFAPVVDATDIKPLLFLYPGQSRRLVNCRCRKLAAPLDVYRGTETSVNVMVQLDAVDPRAYDDIESYVTVSASAPATVTAVNRGNIAVRPHAVITGPCGSPTLTNVTTGQSLILNGGLAAGQTFDIDFDAHVVLYDGVPDYAIVAPAQWWELAPGVNRIAFSASPTGAGTLTLTWSSGWL